MANIATNNDNSPLKQLLLNKDYIAVPKEGETVKGTVISISPREVLIDINGYKTGMVRGYELQEKDSTYPDLKLGDAVEATVLELENDEGCLELSFKFTGQLRAWEAAFEAKQSGQPVEVKITEANRGGLMATWKNMKGFIPVSQLSPENYPRVSGGDKGKILERLRLFAGKTMRAKVLDVDPKEEKLIFSEKALWEEEQKDNIAKYKIGDIIEGEVSAVAEFGAFVSFDGLEGLVHISEIAWQRIDSPADIVKVGDKVRAQILNIQGSKVFLSMKTLIEDPWKNVEKRYQLGQAVKGKVLKVNPFGLFVEIDPEIHGLAHLSELIVTPGVALEAQIKPGDQREFKVVSIEPKHHRLGLSEKALKEEAVLQKAEPQKIDTENTKKAEEAAQAESVQSVVAPTAPAVEETTTPEQSVA